MKRMFLITFTIVIMHFTKTVWTIRPVSNQEWEAYKKTFNKNYVNSDISEATARFYYTFNKFLIDRHNDLYKKNLRTYMLAVNQFSDMRFIHFSALFPQATSKENIKYEEKPDVLPPPQSYDPRDNGFEFNIENQGRKCSSGWAYAAVKSIEIFKSQQLGPMKPPSLSAQNMIDCAGRLGACKNQIPLAAFNYLTLYNMPLYLESEYRNNNSLSEPQMCTPSGTSDTYLDKYYVIQNDDDAERVKAYLSNGYPLVVEFNPTSFEFMHYKMGVFQQPKTRWGSHFMVLLGYGTDKQTGKDYWLLQNSFDTTWGENGYIKLLRSNTMQLTRNAIMPLELV